MSGCYLLELERAAMKAGRASAPYGWLITRDHLEDGETSEVGTSGPSDIAAEVLTSLQAGVGRKFRMSDGDGETYYTGLFIGLDGQGVDSEHVMAPLDDFGMPNAGCVDIAYWIRPFRSAVGAACMWVSL